MSLLPLVWALGTGASVYGVQRTTSGRLNYTETPAPPSAAVLAGRAGLLEGAHRVNGGVLAWDPRWDAAAAADPEHFQFDGRRYRMGTTDAAFAMYDMVARYGMHLTQLQLMLEGSMSPTQLRRVYNEFARSSRYPLHLMTPAQRHLAMLVVHAAVWWAVGLRMLAEMYEAVGPALGSNIRPRRYHRLGVSLERIDFAGNHFDPMAHHRGINQRPGVLRVPIRRPIDWRRLSAVLVAAYSAAYPELIEHGPASELIADLQVDNSRRQPNPVRYMGALPAVAWVVIAIVGFGGLVMLGRHAITAGATGFGINLLYNDQLLESAEEFRDCCLDQSLPESERERCCHLLTETWQRIESLETPLSSAFQWVLLGGTALVGYVGYRHLTRKK